MAGRARRAAACIDHRRDRRGAARAAKQRAFSARHSVRRLPRHRHIGRALFWPYTVRMVAASVRPQLTRVSFRRDVRLFLASLVGFLIILLSGVLVLLQRFEQEAEQSIRSNWAHSADLARRELGAFSSAEQSELQTRLLFVLGRYDLAGATVTRLNGRPVSAGLSPRDPGLDSLVEPLPYGTFTAVFDASTIHHIRTTFVVTVSGALVAAAIATILLLLYLPRITGPVEEMLASAAELRDRSPHDDEQQYLIDTFRES